MAIAVPKPVPLSPGLPAIPKPQDVSKPDQHKMPNAPGQPA